MRTASKDLEQEDDAARFLGIKISKNKHGQLLMRQQGLTDQVIEAFELHDRNIHGKLTPFEAKPFVKDAHGKNISRNFSYGSVISVLLYLSGHI